MSHRRLAVLAVATLVCACERVSEKQAYALVERYNSTIADAYRSCDIKLIDTVVAPNSRDGKNLTGLIGVRIDAGVTLDSHLLSLQVDEVVYQDEVLTVRTTERWRYRDLEVGTGRQLGPESFDTYEIAYTFEKRNGIWLVSETEFAGTPEVGRDKVPWGMDWASMHGDTLRRPRAQDGHGE